MTSEQIADIIGSAGSVAIPIMLAVLAREWHRFDKTLDRLSHSIDRLTERVEKLEERHEGTGSR